MITFEKPSFKVVSFDKDNNKAKIVIDPLERGFGITLGNSLRRVLLSSLPGASISNIQIQGVMHEFSSINGVVEDVTHIIINLKKIIFKMDQDEPVSIYLKTDKEGTVKAKDIILDKNIIEIINPDQEIATISKGGSLDMKIIVNKGRGYVRNEQINQEEKIIGMIPIDSVYTPIRNVFYNVDTKVSKYKIYDILNIEVETNGSITPLKAISLASKILSQHLEVLINLDMETKDIDFLEKKEKKDFILEKEEIKLETLELPVRAIKSLKNQNICTIDDLLEYRYEDLLKIKNLGKKSIDELVEIIESKGYKLKK